MLSISQWNRQPWLRACESCYWKVWSWRWWLWSSVWYFYPWLWDWDEPWGEGDSCYIFLYRSPVLFLQGVTGNISGDSCSLVGESFSFRSESVHKGAMAEMVIQKNLGQALQHRNMIVYQVFLALWSCHVVMLACQGELEFTYHDQACFPVYQEDNSGQWCL